MADSLRLERNNISIDLYPWLSQDPSIQSGTEALAGIEGFGLPPVSAQWFEGAGEGSTWRSSRVLKRPVSIPLYVYAENRADLFDQVNVMSVLLDPSLGQSRLIFGGHDDEEWYMDVVRESGGDWKRKVDSDDRTFFKTTLGLTAGIPFWTRSRPEKFTIETEADSLFGLLPNLAMLQLTEKTAFGELNVSNIGNTRAWPIWTIQGPLSEFDLVSSDGQHLHWSGQILASETITIDTLNGLVTDQTGENRYDQLDTAPKFWAIQPGSSTVTVGATDADVTTSITATWQPRRWAVV